MRLSETIKEKGNTFKLVYCGMLIGLSAVGALIKIQGSIAFDSMPGFFGALFLGPSYGALVSGLGHLLTAVTSGFPLTIPMHLIITLEMALFGYVFGWLYKKTNWITASAAAIILNGPIAAMAAAYTSILLNLPLNGWPLFSFVIVPLTVASALNVLLAYGVFKVLGR